MLSPISVKPIAGALGAELSGVDLGTDATFEELAEHIEPIMDMTAMDDVQPAM